MARAPFFDGYRTVPDVHQELINLLSCEYLVEGNDGARKFCIRSWKYLNTPKDKQKEKVEDVLEALRAKGKFTEGNYEVLKELTKEIDDDIDQLITEAEEKIENIKNETTSSTKKKEKDRELQVRIDVQSDMQKKGKAVVLAVFQWTIQYSNKSQIPKLIHCSEFETIITDLYIICCESYTKDHLSDYGRKIFSSCIEKAEESFKAGKKQFLQFKKHQLPELKRFITRSGENWRKTFSAFDAEASSVLCRCVYLYLKFDSVIGLERFWHYYTSCQFERDLNNCFNSSIVLKLINVDRLNLSVCISDIEYRNLHEYLDTRAIPPNIRTLADSLIPSDEEKRKRQTTRITMSDNGATAFPTQLVVSCGFCCEANNVNWFCKSCPQSLCNTCKTSHLTDPVYKHHIVIPRTNDVMRLYKPSKIADQCRIHPEKEISTYCNDCQVPCCVSCLVKNHPKHSFSTIEDAYLSAENRLNDKVKELENGVLPKLNKMADKTIKERSEKRVHVDRIKEEVNNFRKEIKQAADKSCDNLIEKLEQDDIEFDNVIARIDSERGQIHKMIKEVNEIIQKGDLSMIKYSSHCLSTFIPEVPTSRLTIPVFTPGRDILTIIDMRTGTIDWTDRNPESKHTMSPPKKIDPAMINIYDVMSFRSEVHVTSMTTAGNNTAWVIYRGSNTMYLYDSSAKLVRSITVKGSNGINDMTIRRSGEMIVTCTDDRIRRISVSGEVSTLIDTSPFVPEGICLTESEDVVVCMRGQGKKNHVAVYSPDTGRQLREIRGVNSKGKQHIKDPYRVVSNSKDICVVNESRNNVVCVDESGQVSWVSQTEKVI